MISDALLAVARIAQAQNPTPKIVSAADAFLATLTPEQRGKVFYAFTDETQRARWSNFPTVVVARGGISLKQMSATQQAAAMKLMEPC